MAVSTSSNDVKDIASVLPESPADIRKRKRRRVSSIPEGLDDQRISHLGPLIPPCCLLEQLPLSDVVADVVSEGRREVQEILHGRDDRLVCIVGPCSVHDIKATKEYALVSSPIVLPPPPHPGPGPWLLYRYSTKIPSFLFGQED